MKIKGKVFSVLAAVSALCFISSDLIQGSIGGYLKYLFSFQSILWMAFWILTAVFFFISKSRVGIMISVILLSGRYLYDYVKEIIEGRVPNISVILYMLAFVSFIAVSILYVCRVKAVAVLGFLPAAFFLASELTDLDYLKYLFKYLFEYKDYVFLLINLILFLCFFLFSGLFFAINAGEKKNIQQPVQSPSYQQSAYIPPVQPQQPSVQPSSLICEKCGAENGKDSKFCLACGQPLNTSVFCSKCGAKNDASSKFCLSCGSQL